MAKKMNAAVKGKWLDALRGGKYKQGRYALRNTVFGGQDTFCCLGVLCELAVEAGVIDAPALDGGWWYAGGEAAILPRKVMNWAGLVSQSGLYSTKNDEECLASDNDNGMTFEEIAKIIEKHF